MLNMDFQEMFNFKEDNNMNNNQTNCNEDKIITAIDYLNFLTKKNNIDFNFNTNTSFPAFIYGELYQNCKLVECRKTPDNDVEILVKVNKSRCVELMIKLYFTDMLIAFNSLTSNNLFAAERFSVCWIPFELIQKNHTCHCCNSCNDSCHDKEVEKVSKDNEEKNLLNKMKAKSIKNNIKYKDRQNTERMIKKASLQIAVRNALRDKDIETKQTEPGPKVNRKISLTDSPLKNSNRYSKTYKQFENTVNRAFDEKYGRNTSNNEYEINKINEKISKENKNEHMNNNVHFFKNANDIIYIVNENEKKTGKLQAMNLSDENEVNANSLSDEEKSFFNAIINSNTLPNNIKRVIIKTILTYNGEKYYNTDWYFDPKTAGATYYQVDIKDDVLSEIIDFIEELSGENIIKNSYRFFKFNISHREIILINTSDENLTLNIDFSEIINNNAKFHKIGGKF